MDKCGRGKLKKGCLLLAEGIKSISDTGESSCDEGLVGSASDVEVNKVGDDVQKSRWKV